jgi:hypothetical protein
MDGLGCKLVVCLIDLLAMSSWDFNFLNRRRRHVGSAFHSNALLHRCPTKIKCGYLVMDLYLELTSAYMSDSTPLSVQESDTIEQVGHAKTFGHRRGAHAPVTDLLVMRKSSRVQKHPDSRPWI